MTTLYTLETYKKRFPGDVRICLVCEKEFVPKMEGRMKKCVTCSHECAYIWCNQFGERRKQEARDKWLS